MSLTAQYVDGKLLQSTGETTKTPQTKETTKGSSEMDKDAFLQLLVAQMKYQDPLEPTSNTEYISQYATFSELEQMQNMSGSLSLSRASETVGKQVIIETRTESGEIKTVQGYVEKVVYNGTKAFLSIDGSLYSIDDLKQVIDDEYLEGTKAIDEIKKIIDKLPKPEFVTINDVNDILNAFNYYNSLTDYQESLLPKDLKELLDEYGKKAEEIINAIAEKNAKENEENVDTEKGIEPKPGTDENKEDNPVPDGIEELFKDSETEEV